MTQITISYHKYNDQLANCQIELPNDSVAELRLHFQRFLGPELNQGTFTQNGERTTIQFQASKAKIQTLEKVIQATQRMTARLN